MSAADTIASMKSLQTDRTGEELGTLLSPDRVDELLAYIAQLESLAAAAKAVHDEHWCQIKGEWSMIQGSPRRVVEPKYNDLHYAVLAVYPGK